MHSVQKKEMFQWNDQKLVWTIAPPLFFISSSKENIDYYFSYEPDSVNAISNH